MTTTIPDWLPDPVKTCIVSGAHLVEFDPDTGECEACGFAESAEWDFQIDEQGPIAGTSLPPYTNGWSRCDVFAGDNGTGDDTIGYSYEALYLKGDAAIELTYYVVGHHENYDVELRVHTYRMDEEEQIISGTEDINYEHPLDFGFTEFEQALRSARNAAIADERFKLG